MESLETQEFLISLKRFIARKGRPQKIYSDNGTTFVGVANWLAKLMKKNVQPVPCREQDKLAVQPESSPLVGGEGSLKE